MTNSQLPQNISPLRNCPAWAALEAHYQQVRHLDRKQLFAEDPQRSRHFTLEALGLYFDYSKHRITSETLDLLN